MIACILKAFMYPDKYFRLINKRTPHAGILGHRNPLGSLMGSSDRIQQRLDFPHYVRNSSIRLYRYI
jgi:hypothetical protein